MSQFECATSGIRIRIGNFQGHPPTSEHSPIYSDPSWENLMINFIRHRNRMIQSFLLWFTHGCYLSALRQLLSCFTIHCLNNDLSPIYISKMAVGLQPISSISPQLFHYCSFLLLSTSHSARSSSEFTEGVIRSITRWIQFRIQQTAWTIIQQGEKVNN